jgi:hypothetical protein
MHCKSTNDSLVVSTFTYYSNASKALNKSRKVRIGRAQLEHEKEGKKVGALHVAFSAVNRNLLRQKCADYCSKRGFNNPTGR